MPKPEPTVVAAASAQAKQPAAAGQQTAMTKIMAAATDAASPVSLGQMSQLAELRNPEDDWTGMTRAADRRRRQNRLNQRAYRRRQKAQRSPELDSVSDDGCVELVVRPPGPQCSESCTSSGYLIPPSPQERATIFAFMEVALLRHSLNTSRPVCLTALVRLNALNAVACNATLLGIPPDGLCEDALLSPFGRGRPLEPGSQAALARCPASLVPTPVQQSMEHHPWSDLLPLPRLRDNILRGVASGALDEDELCYGLLDVANVHNHEDAALLHVWGEPWDVRNWEASAAFLRKWGWLLEGCGELMEATNYWRQKRGESRVVTEL